MKKKKYLIKCIHCMNLLKSYGSKNVSNCRIRVIKSITRYNKGKNKKLMLILLKKRIFRSYFFFRDLIEKISSFLIKIFNNSRVY